MLSYLFMKILERRPRSYDRRMDRLSRGRVRVAKEAIAAEVPAGARVLEIGCGTGELASLLVGRGALVEGFDLSPAMVAVARERIEGEKLEGRFAVRRMGVDGMDALASAGYDAVVSALVLSELDDDQRRFALRQTARVLKPGGRLVVADEVVPRSWGRRALQGLVRAPMLVASYLVARGVTRPIRNLDLEIFAAGLVVEKLVRSKGDVLAIVVARRGDSEEGR